MVKPGLADLELVNEDGDGVELVVLLRIHGGRLKLVVKRESVVGRRAARGRIALGVSVGFGGVESMLVCGVDGVIREGGPADVSEDRLAVDERTCLQGRQLDRRVVRGDACRIDKGGFR